MARSEGSLNTPGSFWSETMRSRPCEVAFQDSGPDPCRGLAGQTGRGVREGMSGDGGLSQNRHVEG